MKAIPLTEICTIVGLQLGVRNVQGSDHLLSNLGAESIDLLNIVTKIEAQYGVEIDEVELSNLGTVTKLHQLVVSLVENGTGVV